MAKTQNHDYIKRCAELASGLSISLESARRRVEAAAGHSGRRDPVTRLKTAERLLEEMRLGSEQKSCNQCLDALLTTAEDESNFMLED